MLLVTHDIDEAIYMSDRIVIMTQRPGKIEQIIHVDIDRPRGPEDRHGMIDVVFFLGGNFGEGRAQAARRDLSYTLVAGDGEGLAEQQRQLYL